MQYVNQLQSIPSQKVCILKSLKLQPPRFPGRPHPLATPTSSSISPGSILPSAATAPLKTDREESEKWGAILVIKKHCFVTICPRGSFVVYNYGGAIKPLNPENSHYYFGYSWTME